VARASRLHLAADRAQPGRREWTKIEMPAIVKCRPE